MAELPPGWTTAAVAELFDDTTRLATKVPQGQFAEAGSIPIIDQGSKPLAGYSTDSSAAYPGKVPVILFGDHSRVVKYADRPFVLGADGVKVLTPAENLRPRYAYFALRGLNVPSAGYSRHFKFLKELQITVPPIEEQRRIAGILDHVDDLRAKRRDSIARLDTLREAEFTRAYETFDESPRKLTEIAGIFSGITKGRKPPAGILTDTPYLAVSNVQDGHLDLTTVKNLAVSDAEVRKFEVHPGDILLTEGGDPDKLGRGTIWRGELPSAIHQNHIFRVQTRDPRSASPEFLSLALRSREARSHFRRSAKQTTGIATINKTQLSRTPIRIPGAERQREIVDCIQAIEGQKERYRAQLAELDRLFASLQARAFRGEL